MNLPMSKFSRRIWLAVALSAVGGMAQVAEAAVAEATKIQVTDMHCAHCARKIAGKLIAVRGVASVRTSVSAHTATISHQPSQQPSAKALWEAVEKAGFKPIKLEGPAGTFTEKPKE